MATLLPMVFLSMSWSTSSVTADLTEIIDEACASESVASFLQLGHTLTPGISPSLLGTTAAHFASAAAAPKFAWTDDNRFWMKYVHSCSLWCMMVALMIVLKPACSKVLTKLASSWSGVAQTKLPAGASSLCSLQHNQASPKSSATDQQVCEAYDLLPPMDNEASLCDILSSSDQPAIAGAAPGSPVLTYAQLRYVMTAEVWDVLFDYDVVAFALPPGPELATTLVCLLNKATCAPLDPNLSVAECAAALRQFAAKALLVVPAAAPGALQAALSLSLPTFSLLTSTPVPGSPPVWELCPLGPLPVSAPVQEAVPNKNIKTKGAWSESNDVAMLLRTSGTTGKSKVVPLRLRQLVHGAKAIAASIDLGSNDVCLNAMPLFHIGGISCNLLGTLVSGGLVICSEKRFEPKAFADLLTKGKLVKQPTWYYSSPSMHLALADAGVVETHSLRLVRSGAAALPPVLQERLEQLFQCEVLATYSMTECMPIASPVLRVDSKQYGPRCQPLGSVGRPIGPSVEVVGSEVMVRGPLVTTGYQGGDGGWTSQGLFPTGDLGRLDENGFLWLLGRKKEVINQGGETLAPQEIEEQAITHNHVKEVAAYPVAHPRLGEAVALAVVLEGGRSVPHSRLLDLADEIAGSLAPGRRPAVFAFVASLARTSTGKLQRFANPRVELTDANRRMVVLDARVIGPGDVPLVLCISAEPNTLAEIYAEASKDSSSAEDSEIYDSMGILQQASRCRVFETCVVSNMYVLGFLGLTLSHIARFCDVATFQHISEEFLDFGDSVCGNGWHLGVFFTGAGYLDAKYNQQLDRKDLVMYLMLPGIPIICSLLPVSWQVPWANIHHPARWFVCCMLVCRLYTTGCSRMRVPKPFQALMIVPLGTWWQMAQRLAASLCRPSKILNYIMQVFLSEYVYGFWEANKVASCTIMYVLAYLFLPGIVQSALSMGPKTVRGERRLGLFCWCLFISIVVAWRFQSPLCVTTSGLTWNCPDHISKLIFIVPIGVLLDFCVIGVLGAANAYLPIQLPDVATNSLLGALLLMPITILGSTSRVIAYMTSSHSSMLQLYGLLTVAYIYLGIIAPLFQTMVMKAIGGIIGFAEQMLGLLYVPLSSESPNSMKKPSMKEHAILEAKSFDEEMDANITILERNINRVG